jgi:hypothetical protein
MSFPEVTKTWKLRPAGCDGNLVDVTVELYSDGDLMFSQTSGRDSRDMVIVDPSNLDELKAILEEATI